MTATQRPSFAPWDVYRVLVPRKIAAYTYYQRAIQSLLAATATASASAAERSADRRAALEAVLVEMGGLAGPDTLGMEAT